MNMGGGDLDGLPSLERVRDFFASRPELRAPPVVILSGEADPKEHARYAAKGATRVVVKPATQEALRGLRALACEHAAGRKQAAGAGAAGAQQQPIPAAAPHGCAPAGPDHARGGSAASSGSSSEGTESSAVDIRMELITGAQRL